MTDIAGPHYPLPSANALQAALRTYVESNDHMPSPDLLEILDQAHANDQAWATARELVYAGQFEQAKDEIARLERDYPNEPELAFLSTIIQLMTE